jgi:hypothetical protein
MGSPTGRLAARPSIDSSSIIADRLGATRPHADWTEQLVGFAVRTNTVRLEMTIRSIPRASHRPGNAGEAFAEAAGACLS